MEQRWYDLVPFAVVLLAILFGSARRIYMFQCWIEVWLLANWLLASFIRFDRTSWHHSLNEPGREFNQNETTQNKQFVVCAATSDRISVNIHSVHTIELWIVIDKLGLKNRNYCVFMSDWNQYLSAMKNLIICTILLTIQFNDLKGNFII